MMMFISESSSGATSLPDAREEPLSALASLELPEKPGGKPILPLAFLAGKSFYVGRLLAGKRRNSKKISLALLIPTVTQNTKYT